MPQPPPEPPFLLLIIKSSSDVLSRYNPQDFSILGLYNAGNILNEDEIPFDALEKICVLIYRSLHQEIVY